MATATIGGKHMTVGSVVRLRRDVGGVKESDLTEVARITREHESLAPGAVTVSPSLGGFGWWNKADLVLVAQVSR
jgi:hypothetical protein